MKLFLAGGTGVIGRRTLPILIAAGHHVSVVSRSPDKDAQIEAAGGVPVRVDLFDADGLAAATAGHDAVVNLATNIPPMTKAARASAWATNDRIRTEGVANLVAAARSAGASRVVQESITFPYADAGAEWIDEDSERTASPFSAPVDAAESAVRSFTDGPDQRGVVLRFAQFVAADSNHVQTFLSAYRKRVSPLAGDPEGYTSFVHADDAAAAVVAALDAPAGVYNIAEDEPATRADIDRAVAAALGRKAPRSVPRAMRTVATKVNPGADTLMRSQRISNRRFRSATGWEPMHRTATEFLPAVLLEVDSPS